MAVDLSSHDDQLFAYTQLLVDKIGAEKIYLLHVIPNPILLENPVSSYRNLLSTDNRIDENVKNLLNKKVDQYFNSDKLKVEIEVVEGAPYKELLQFAEGKEIDLVVVGKKKASEGSGITAKRLVRKTKASVLFVPDDVNAEFKSILVPVDYSDHSAKALRLSLLLKEQSQNELEVEALHVTRLLPMDNHYGLSRNQVYIDTLLENSKKSFDTFIRKESFDKALFSQEVIPVRFNNIGEDIQSFAKRHDLDLIMIGANGHSAFDSVVFGSVTEQLVNLPMDIPILVLR